MKAIITGSEGFVGKYMRAELESNGYQVLGIDLFETEGTRKIDLLDAEAVNEIIAEEKPDVIIHLAGQANVGASWKIPQKTIEINVIGAINILEAIRENDLDSHVVIVGSADQYGKLGANGASVTEDMETRPQSPYAVSKKAQEEMAKIYAESYGISVCMTRSFNHYGPGQREGFLVADFSSQIAKIEKKEQDVICVGNLAAERDFTHVKDVVRAYRLIAEKGQPGEIYNVGTGKTHVIQAILDELVAMAQCDVRVEKDPTRMRPSDAPVICCNRDKLTTHTGWEPEVDLKEGLKETLEYWRTK